VEEPAAKAAIVSELFGTAEAVPYKDSRKSLRGTRKEFLIAESCYRL
jgi:hypothetical protein